MAFPTGQVLQAPSRTLDAWMAVEVPFDGSQRPWTLHLVGWRVEGGRGQVSSPVEAIDPVRRLARTRSGRVYELREVPGLNPDAFSTWCAWKRRHNVPEERDVSDELAQLFIAAGA